MKRFLLSLSLFGLILLSACSVNRTLPETDLAEFTILQINDVYEIAPIEGGAAGGLARVCRCRQRGPTRHAGQFFLLAARRVNDERTGDT